jgi:hypothetical protein
LAKPPKPPWDRETGKRVEPDLLTTYAEPLAQYYLRPESKFLNSEHADSGPRDATACRRGQILHIGNEANKWEEQYFLREVEDSEV